MKLPHSVIVKSPGLLPMLYAVSELAHTLCLPDRTLRDWLDTGAPHQRDDNGRIWINGAEFAQWVKNQRKPKKEPNLLQGFAYCFKCKEAVELAGPAQIPKCGLLYHIRGTCPNCGTNIVRGASYAKNS